jgi:diaminopimelate epimerase
MLFWKMQGLGNDYIVVDSKKQRISDQQIPKLAKKLCQRRFSIGADGLLLVYPSNVADVKMRIFNADGSEAEMCGNGIRCFSKYCYENGIVLKNPFNVETLSGIKQIWLTIKDSEVYSVKVDMGAPNWERSALSIQGQGTFINETLEIDNKPYTITCLSMGNPHCIIFVEKVEEFPVNIIGPIVENYKAFPYRTNVAFVQILNRNELKVRVWERGCGETLACGTGTCAAVAAANRLGRVNNNVTVHLLGGDLKVEVGKTLLLIGAAEKVFEGTLFQEP